MGEIKQSTPKDVFDEAKKVGLAAASGGAGAEAGTEANAAAAAEGAAVEPVVEVETPEERERREEKERVLTALHAYYQERQQNTPLQTELAQKIERGKQLAQALVPYFQAGIKAGCWKENVPDLKDVSPSFEASEIGLTILNEEGNPTGRWFPGKSFPKTLDDRFFAEEFAKDKAFAEIKRDVAEVFPALPQLGQSVRAQREQIFRELLVALGYGGLVAQGKVGQWGHGLYDLEGGKISLDFDSKKEFLIGETSFFLEKSIYSHHIEAMIEAAKARLGITDQEIAQATKLEWSKEEKDKLQRLMGAANLYREKLPAAKPQQTPFYQFSDQDYQLTLSLEMAAYTRSAYDKLGLPPQHKERVVQQIRSTGRVEF